MEPAVGFLQPGDGDAKATLGGGQAAVAEDFLAAVITRLRPKALYPYRSNTVPELFVTAVTLK